MEEYNMLYKEFDIELNVIEFELHIWHSNH